jgi:hypothetical protein
MMNSRRLFEFGGILAGLVLLGFGVAVIVPSASRCCWPGSASSFSPPAEPSVGSHSAVRAVPASWPPHEGRSAHRGWAARRASVYMPIEW